MKYLVFALALSASSAYARFDNDADYSHAKLQTANLELTSVICQVGDGEKHNTLIAKSGARAVDFATCLTLLNTLSAAISCHGSAKVTVIYDGTPDKTVIGYDPKTVDLGNSECR